MISSFLTLWLGDHCRSPGMSYLSRGTHMGLPQKQ
jgi:hypothetical protein